YQFFITYDKNIPILEAVFNCLELFLTIIAFIISCLTTRYSEFEVLGTECEAKCPMNDFNIFSKIFIFWMKTILKQGYKSTADLAQYLLPICDYMKSLHAFNAFESANRKYNSNKLKPKTEITLFPLLVWTAWTPYLFGSLMELIHVCVDLSQPFILSKLIDFVSDTEHLWHGLCYAVAYSLINLISQLLECHSNLFINMAYYRTSSALISALYQKMLRLSQLGPSSLTLLAVMLIVGPFTTFVMTRIDTLQTKQMQLKDKRMEQISEVLSNIKLLKLFGWEKPFIDRISETRRQELHTLKLKNYFWSCIDVLWIVVPFIIAGITFTIFIYTSGQPFTAKTAFVSLSVYISLKAPMGS
ncbi:unnamed protein product, partial [Oppiella nova]